MKSLTWSLLKGLLIGVTVTAVLFFGGGLIISYISISPRFAPKRTSLVLGWARKEEPAVRENLEHLRSRLAEAKSSYGACPKTPNELKQYLNVIPLEMLTAMNEITTTPSCTGGWYFDPTKCRVYINVCERDSKGKRYIDW